MYETGREVKIADRSFFLVFNTSALLEITQRYGGLEMLGDAFEKEPAKAIAEVPWLIALLANQGIALKNEETTEKESLITAEWVALHMKPKQLIRQKDIVMQAITDGMTDDDQDAEDDDTDEVLEDIVSEKNVAGAGG